MRRELVMRLFQPCSWNCACATGCASVPCGFRANSFVPSSYSSTTIYIRVGVVRCPIALAFFSILYFQLSKKFIAKVISVISQCGLNIIMIYYYYAHTSIRSQLSSFFVTVLASAETWEPLLSSFWPAQSVKTGPAVVYCSFSFFYLQSCRVPGKSVQ